MDAAAEAGADAVKFQTFVPEALAAAGAVKADYQRERTGADGSQLDMLRALALTRDDHLALLARCAERGIEFLSTPFDDPSLDLLAELGLRRLKLGSGELTNLPLLRRAAALGLPLILSTGMADLDEVRAAVAALAAAGLPRSSLTLLHCTTLYPTPLDEVNLRAMTVLATAFPGVAVGFSDHTPGIEAALAATALGATVIEKHFTLDRSLPGPDHQASLTPEELAALVRGVRNVELALGDGVKRPRAAEAGNRASARKQIVAARAIRAGESFGPGNLTCKRTGRPGLSPMRWDEVMGAVAPRDFAPDEPVELALGRERERP